MKLFVQQLDEKSETALDYALGKNIGFLFPEVNISTNSAGFSTTSVSITLDHKSYLIIENDWADTPYEAIDFYFFSALLSDKPKDIKVTEHSGNGWLHHNASTLNTWDYNIVSKITIYEFSESYEDESVKYDAAILFEFENEKQILLSREETIAAFIEVNHELEIINQILNTMKLRKQLKKTTEDEKNFEENSNASSTRLKITYY